MGRTKHGKDSARAKACAKYKAEGRHIINKQEKAKIIAAGKKIKSRKTPKTSDMKWDTLIRNTVQTKPYVDPVSGNVFWGKDKDDGKVVVKNKKKKVKAA